MNIDRETMLRAGFRVGRFERAVEEAQAKMAEAQRLFAIAEGELSGTLLDLLGSDVIVLASSITSATGGSLAYRLAAIADLVASNPPATFSAEIIRIQDTTASVVLVRTDDDIDVRIVVIGTDREVIELARSEANRFAERGIDVEVIVEEIEPVDDLIARPAPAPVGD